MYYSTYVRTEAAVKGSVAIYLVQIERLVLLIKRAGGKC